MLVGVVAVALVVAATVLTVVWWSLPEDRRPIIHPMVKVVGYTLISLALIVVVAGFAFAFSATLEFSK